MLGNGEFLVTAFNLKLGSTVYFRSKAVLLSSGGIPFLPKYILSYKDELTWKFMSGDEILR